VPVCSLTNFDAYTPLRPDALRPPRPGVVALKSSENLALFEDAADYLHFFACAQDAADVWLERILLARVRRPPLPAPRAVLTCRRSHMCSTASATCS
jgi:hypothetical protein